MFRSHPRQNPSAERHRDAARAMLEEGHWIVPHLAGEPYLTKPPLYPWLVAWLGHLWFVRTKAGFTDVL